MAHKKKINQNTKSEAYTIGDAIKVADDIFKLSKENKYNLGAFIHGLVFAVEYAQSSYRIPQQQMAIVRRSCRKYFKEIDNINKVKS
jgi:hypothetical protein